MTFRTVFLEVVCPDRQTVRVPSYDGVDEAPLDFVIRDVLWADEEIVSLAIAVDEDPMQGPTKRSVTNNP